MLLVEPHADTRELYHLWLTQHACSVTVALSASEALATARTAAPDVLVVEPMLEEGGLPLLRALRREPSCRDAVLAVVTTAAGEAMRRHALEAGADVYLVKPCVVSELGLAIARASRDRLRLVPPDAVGGVASRARLRHAVRRSRAICERLDGGGRGSRRPAFDS